MTWKEFKDLGDKAIKDDEVLELICTEGIYVLNGINVYHNKDGGEIVIVGSELPGVRVGNREI